MLADHWEDDGLMRLEIADGRLLVGPMRVLYPAISAARIAANFRKAFVSPGLSSTDAGALFGLGGLD
jgi:hypothetical protein